MPEELGKIEKPEAEPFTGKRKLYLVPLIFGGKEAPPEYLAKCNLYWEQVGQHVGSLEAKVGRVSHVYCESITQGGEEGLKVMERLNPSSCQIVKDRCQSGAVLEAAEDRELFEETMDWERFLLLGFMSQKVSRMVSEFYVEASKKRYQHIAQKIDDTLKADEAGILFIREGHGVQFPPGIEVFSVAPPALDEIHRWQRERPSAEGTDEPEEENKQ